MAKFGITANHGFHITFNNNVTISVQFGEGHYCSNRQEATRLGQSYENYESFNAEVAIWDEFGNWITPNANHNDDKVLGWQTPDEVFALMKFAKEYKP